MLTATELEYINLLWKTKRDAHQQARKYGREWRQARADFDARAVANRWPDTTKRDLKKTDYAMVDAMSAWQWWRDEAVRIDSDIAAELALIAHVTMATNRPVPDLSDLDTPRFRVRPRPRPSGGYPAEATTVANLPRVPRGPAPGASTTRHDGSGPVAS